jgi:hypothetical protein
MPLSFTEVNTGAEIILDKVTIQAAYEYDDFRILELVSGTYVDVSDSWSSVVAKLAGGGGGVGGAP